jgi:mRNA-degrading endonuclease toxin of MazEF toxin-antitoxin module
MMRVNFGGLRKIIRDITSKNKPAKDSSVCLSEFLSVVSNTIEHNHSLMQDELANVTMSMQNWILRREFTSSREAVKIGDIFYADLGCNYKPEYSYHHPVLVLEKVGNMVMVVPVSTSPNNITEAFHPEDNPKGSKYLRKVYGADVGEKSDGFEKTGAILLSDIKTISKGRLIEKKGSVNSALFQDIKSRVFKLAFPKQNIELYNTKSELDKLKNEHQKLLAEYNNLKEKLQNSGPESPTE